MKTNHVIRPAILLLLSLALHPISAVAVPATLQLIGSEGSQTFLNSAVGYAWNFSFSNSANYGDVTAQFSLKTGPSTVANVDVKIYQVGGSNSAPILSGSLTPASASQSFATKIFNLGAYNFLASESYRMTLTSDAAAGSTTWYIKDPTSLTATDPLSLISLNSAPIAYDPATTDPSIESSLSASAVPDDVGPLHLLCISIGSFLAFGVIAGRKCRVPQLS